MKFNEASWKKYHTLVFQILISKNLFPWEDSLFHHKKKEIIKTQKEIIFYLRISIFFNQLD